MKIAVIGAGYVGLANALALGQKYDVVIADIDKNKVEKINKKESPILDLGISRFLMQSTRVCATNNIEVACRDASYVFVCVPTNFDEVKGSFDISIIDGVISQILEVNLQATIVIKSTVPIGYTSKIKCKSRIKSIIFSPEFLREGFSMEDTINPSRIIIGVEKNVENAQKRFLELWEGIINGECMQKVKITNYADAEAIKLFANSYLALRVAFFNELDSFAIEMGLSSKDIIDGVCWDNRIGMYYNNPSFGYGGSCLPKDIRQLHSQYCIWDSTLVSATLLTNEKRKHFIASKIIDQIARDGGSKIVGFYRMTAKSNSDNFRTSAVVDIFRMIQNAGIQCVVYEPLLVGIAEYENILIADLEEFKHLSHIIVANRNTAELEDVQEKVFSRDIYFRE